LGIESSSTTDAASLRAGLSVEAERLGFAAFGIAPADAAPAAGARLRQWLADGCHGEMLWMAETSDRRASPAGLWSDVRSVVMLGTSYAPTLDPLRHHGHPDIGTVSVYALGGDYHDVIKKRLKALARWLVAAAPSQQLACNAPGLPVFRFDLLRHRGGKPGFSCLLEWDRDHQAFAEVYPGAAPAAAFERAGAAPERRRAA